MRNGWGHARGTKPPQWLSGRRGYVLLISMGLLGLLAMLGTTFVLLSRSEQEASANFVDQVRARMIAFSGMEHAFGELAQADRLHPWSGHLLDGAVGVIAGVPPPPGYGYNPDAISGLPGKDPGGTDHWFYGEQFKVPTVAVTPDAPAPIPPTTRQYGRGLPQPGRVVGGLAPATDVSFRKGIAKNDLGQDVGYSSDPAVLRGTYVNQPDNPGDFYILKVTDCASRLFVNDTNLFGRMQRMLNTLGGELVPPFAGLGDKINAGLGARDAVGNPVKPYLSEGDLAARAGIPTTNIPGLKYSVIDQIRDFITFHAWQDPKVIRARFSPAAGDPAVDPKNPFDMRAPININTAPREVLVAALNGISATYHKHNSGVTPVGNPANYDTGDVITVSINLASARAFADHIIKCRYYYAGGSAVIAYPHVDWMHVFQDTFDTAPGATQEQSDLMRAMFCPNTTIKKWNPDVILVDPDIAGRTDFTLLDKTDIRDMTTEFCFGSMGHYDIESTGMVWDVNRRCVASCTLRTAVKTYDVLRLTTQQDFEAYRMFDPVKEKPAPSPFTSRMVSCVTQPEYSVNRPYSAYAVGTDMGGPAAAANAWAAKYDGQLLLNGWIDHRATAKSFMSGFCNGDYAAIQGPPGFTAAPIPSTTWGFGYSTDWDPLPPGPMLPATLTGWQQFYTTTQLHPFGMFFDSEFNRTGSFFGWPTGGSGLPRMILYDNNCIPQSKKCTVEMWFKPLVDLVGTSGWEDRVQCLIDTLRGPGADYMRMSVEKRQVQVYLYTETKGSPVNLIGDLTARTTGPKAWLPHTWHHLEFNWDSETGGGKAQLYVDGDLMDEKPMFKDFDPTMGDSSGFYSFFGPPASNGSLKIGCRGDPNYDNGDPEDRIYCSPYSNTGSFYENQCLMGTVDNVCMHDKILHDSPFPSRSRYHDVSMQSSAYNFTYNKGEADSGPDTDVSGHHGLYQRRLQEIKDSVTANGQATLFNISCTHFHPPHEHSKGDHQGGAVAPGTTLSLGHVSISLKRDATFFEFGYDNCAGTPALEAPGTWMTVATGQDLRLLVKMEIAENSQIPHNVGPIVDDITILYSHGPKTLQFERVNE